MAHSLHSIELVTNYLQAYFPGQEELKFCKACLVSTGQYVVSIPNLYVAETTLLQSNPVSCFVLSTLVTISCAVRS